MNLKDDAIDYVRKHKKELCEKYANTNIYLPTNSPSTFFMAGSPGAGKTEYSKAFINKIEKKEPERKIIRLDPDEIRTSLPNYDPEKADLFQSATGIAVDKIVDYMFKYKQEFLLDGTFSGTNSYENIKRSIKRGRKVGILFLYQDPKIAWEFVKARSALEKRIIPKEAFINSFARAIKNVNNVKADFGKNVELWLIIKDFKQKNRKTYFNIDKLDSYINLDYNPISLAKDLI